MCKYYRSTISWTFAARFFYIACMCESKMFYFVFLSSFYITWRCKKNSTSINNRYNSWSLMLDKKKTFFHKGQKNKLPLTWMKYECIVTYVWSKWTFGTPMSHLGLYIAGLAATLTLLCLPKVLVSISSVLLFSLTITDVPWHCWCYSLTFVFSLLH